MKKGLNMLLSGSLDTLEVVLWHLLFWIPIMGLQVEMAF